MTEAQQFLLFFGLFIAFIVLTATGDYITGLLALGMIFVVLTIRTVVKRK